MTLVALSLLVWLQAGCLGQGAALGAGAFVSGEDGYNTYRIPSLLHLANGDLMLFAEGRKFSSADHDWNDIVAKRSSDQGATWGPLQIIHTESTFDRHVTIGNPAPVALHSHVGAIVLVGCRNNMEVFEMKSFDNGLTWSKVTYFTSQVTPLGDVTHIATGPPAALQLSSGRIIVPADYCLHGGPMVCKSRVGGAYALVSDDLGLTWKMSNLIPDGNECQAALAPNGSLILSMRTFSGYRQFSWSDDGGLSWSVPEHSTFAGGAKFAGGTTASSIVSLPGTETLVISTPFSKTGRKNMSLFVSIDSGASWLSSRQVDAGPSSYSALAAINATHVGLAYETVDVGRMVLKYMLLHVGDTSPLGTSLLAASVSRGKSNTRDVVAATLVAFRDDVETSGPPPALESLLPLSLSLVILGLGVRRGCLALSQRRFQG